EEIVTTTDSAKYDVMQGARLNFIEHRIGPLCRRLEASEDVTVKSLDARAVGWFDLDSLPLMQKAQRDRLATARSAFDMGVPFNELNRVLDLGFRRLPWGDRGYVAARLTEVGEDSPRSKVQGPKSVAAAARPARTVDSGATVAPRWRAEELIVDSQDGVARGVNHPRSAIDDQLARMSALLEAAKHAQAKFEEQSGNEATPVTVHFAALGPQFRSKAQRFLFEQRGRVLARIGQRVPALPADLLD